MPLSNGSRLGPYEIVAPLGAGGMGEVYRARDTRLGRDVAIKVLPAHLSSNPELKQRLEREARAVSSLSHPHICVLHDVGHHDGMDFLVMEYLEGETLAQRLTRGPLALEELLRIGMQVADALEKAHRQGLVHRDLKPGNIMLTRAGAKLLDFGLAKARAMSGVSDLSSTPTVSSPLAGTAGSHPLTAEGTIVGTFQYMSPEQLEGKDADARSDIFAFGAVLYEMAAGKRAFAGKSQASLIASILKEEPRPLTELAPMTPPALERVVRTCLAKDPEERWQTAHDVKLQLQWISEGGSLAGVPAPVVARRKGREKLAWVAAAVLLLTTAVFAAGYFRARSTEVRAIHSYILSPEKAVLEFSGGTAGPPVLSPDGRRIVFRARDSAGKSLLWVRPLDSPTAQPLAGTEGGAFPFWSPDSRYIGFFSGGKLKKIDANGGPPQSLCEASEGRGGSWSTDNIILFSPTPSSPLLRVSAAGGAPSPVTKLDETRRDNTHRWPHFLPDGRHFLVFVRTSGAFGRAETNGIYVGALDSPELKLLVHSEAGGIYVSPGFLLFRRERSLMAQPFDARGLRLTGDAFPVAEEVTHLGGVNYALFSASQNGVLVYQTGGASGAEPVWLDSAGRQVGTVGGAGAHGTVRLSPDGLRMAEFLSDPQTGNLDIWLHDLKRGVPTRFTFEPSFDWFPVWSPDGRRIAFASNRKGNYDLYVKDSTGAGNEEVLLEDKMDKRPTDWSRDARFVAYGAYDVSGKSKWDILILPLSGDRKPFPFLQTEFNEGAAVFSPDGHWLAYQSDESGTPEVYVAPFPGPGGKFQISSGGGRLPLWRRDGKGIFYVTLDNKVMSVDITMKGASAQVGNPQPLFQAPLATMPTFGLPYDVAANGQRFLVLTAGGDNTVPITLVVNWLAAVRK